MSKKHLETRYGQLVATFSLMAFGLLMVSTMKYQIAATLIGLK